MLSGFFNLIDVILSLLFHTVSMRLNMFLYIRTIVLSNEKCSNRDRNCMIIEKIKNNEDATQG